MAAFELSRRAVLVGIGALTVSQVGVIRSAFAQPGTLSGVHVDVSPLIEPTAGWVAQTLPRATVEALAAVGRSGRGVSLRINYVILGPNIGGECGAQRPLRPAGRHNADHLVRRTAPFRFGAALPTTK